MFDHYPLTLTDKLHQILSNAIDSFKKVNGYPPMPDRVLRWKKYLGLIAEGWY